MVERKITIDGILNGAIDVTDADNEGRLFYITKETVDIFIEGLNSIETKDKRKLNIIRWSLDLLEQFKKEWEV